MSQKKTALLSQSPEDALPIETGNGLEAQDKASKKLTRIGCIYRIQDRDSPPITPLYASSGLHERNERIYYLIYSQRMLLNWSWNRAKYGTEYHHSAAVRTRWDATGSSFATRTPVTLLCDKICERKNPWVEIGSKKKHSFKNCTHTHTQLIRRTKERNFSARFNFSLPLVHSPTHLAWSVVFKQKVRKGLAEREGGVVLLIARHYRELIFLSCARCVPRCCMTGSRLYEKGEVKHRFHGFFCLATKIIILISPKTPLGSCQFCLFCNVYCWIETVMQ